jgi:hypothetical protein
VLNEKPFVRYKGDQKLAELVTSRLSEDLDGLWRDIQRTRRNGFQREDSFMNHHERDQLSPSQFFNKDRATLVVFDRRLDLQASLANDYSYFTNVFEQIDVQPDFGIGEQMQALGAKAQETQEVPFLNETDYIWSKYKHSNVSEFQIMRAHEVAQLQKLENIMLKKSDQIKKKDGKDEDETRELLRYLPER